MPATLGSMVSRSFVALGASPLGLLGTVLAYSMLGQIPVRLEQGGSLLGAAALFVAASLGLFLAGATLLAQAGAHLQGRPLTTRIGLAVGLWRAGGLLLVGIVVGFASLVATLLLVLPGVWLFCRWSLAGAAAVDERLGLTAALQRSVALTRGHILRLLGVGVVLEGIALLTSLLLELALRGTGWLGPAMLALEGVNVALLLAASAAALHSLRQAHAEDEQAHVAGVFA